MRSPSGSGDNKTRALWLKDQVSTRPRHAATCTTSQREIPSSVPSLAPGQSFSDQTLPRQEPHCLGPAGSRVWSQGQFRPCLGMRQTTRVPFARSRLRARPCLSSAPRTSNRLTLTRQTSGGRSTPPLPAHTTSLRTRRPRTTNRAPPGKAHFGLRTACPASSMCGILRWRVSKNAPSSGSATAGATGRNNAPTHLRARTCSTGADPATGTTAPSSNNASGSSRTRASSNSSSGWRAGAGRGQGAFRGHPGRRACRS